MERWIAVGRALIARSPTMLEYHLGMLEAVADSLAPSQESSDEISIRLVKGLDARARRL